MKCWPYGKPNKKVNRDKHCLGRRIGDSFHGKTQQDSALKRKYVYKRQPHEYVSMKKVSVRKLVTGSAFNNQRKYQLQGMTRTAHGNTTTDPFMG